MQQFSSHTNRIQQPAKAWLVYLSLCIALGLNYIPTGALRGVPDWMALALAFWSIREPMRVGMGTGFFFGVLVDVGQGAAMGQHALAYVILAFLSNGLARRVMWFPVLVQALHVLPILLVAQGLMVAVRVVAGDEFPGWWYFLSSATGAILWLPLDHLLPQQLQPVDRDENRPI